MHLSSYVAITCASPTSPANGSVSFANGTSAPFDYQTIAIYNCNEGYRLSGGDEIRFCSDINLNHGEWNGTTPECQGNCR